MKKEVDVNCEKCAKIFKVTKGHYTLNVKRNCKFYCSKECQRNSPLNRLINNIQIDENGCWNYTKSGRGKGYEAVKYKGKIVDTHRLSWILYYGPINDSKLFVCHKCDNRKCINPHHLFLGTNSDNMRDAYNKGRLKLSTGGNVFKKGHKPSNSILTDDEVREIRSLLNKNLSIKEIVKLLNISRHKIIDIRRGKSYSNIK